MKQIIPLLFLFLFNSCSSESLSVKEARTLIENFTERYPIYESSKIDIGKQNYRISRDKEIIQSLEKLESEGLISMHNISQSKKWFSRDSIFSANITLTPEASSFVINQKKNSAEVKTFLFRLDKTKEIELEIKNNNKARINATLKKEETPFASLGKDKNPNTTFIKKDFNLRYKKESGWYITK